jgi:hypothetical protein
MINYICDNITVDSDNHQNGIYLENKIVMVSVPDKTSDDPTDRYDHLVAISGALENALQCSVLSFSYNPVT